MKDGHYENIGPYYRKLYFLYVVKGIFQKKGAMCNEDSSIDYSLVFGWQY